MYKPFTAAIAAAVALFPIAAHAGEAQPQYRFTRDGTTYVYTVAPGAGGRQVIEGRRLPGGSAFRLIVDGDRVDGMSGGQPVSFRTSRSGGVMVAAR